MAGVNALFTAKKSKPRGLMKFENKLIVSDIDGTFFDDDMNIADRNIDAINYFKENGGHFTFATGRNEITIPPDVMKIANAPIVCCNGSYIYDPESERKMNEICLAPGPVISIINTVFGGFTGVGVTVTGDKKFYVVGESEYIVPEKLDLSDNDIEYTTLENVPAERWYTVVFHGAPQTIDLVEKFITVKAENDYVISRSWPTMLEINNIRATKGNAALELKRTLENRTKCELKMYGIGDYGNDIDLLRVCDVSACPENAIEAVRDAADLVLCNNNAGSIAELIEYIDANM